MDKEKRSQKLDDEIDKLSNDEQHFLLWQLLRIYSMEKKNEIPEKINTIDDFMKDKYYRDLNAKCNDLIDELRFELWR